MFQDNGILKIGHSLSRKLLWLIPFMLAKKLLTLQLPVAGNNLWFDNVRLASAHDARGMFR
jgi:hypothetical protein